MPKKIIARTFILAAIGVAAWLIYRTLRQYTFDEIVRSVLQIPVGHLLAGIGFVFLSYFCLTLFDTLAVRYVGQKLPYRQVALASFTSLSIGHNVGVAALSSGAVRYRFYSRWGIECRAGGEDHSLLRRHGRPRPHDAGRSLLPDHAGQRRPDHRPLAKRRPSSWYRLSCRFVRLCGAGRFLARFAAPVALEV
ncbi:hypothetical protein AB395_00005306 (plasmid) [Sinorhizobium fredii CCBAU 45436]|nr:hypothetical protein AB395_00005306 [Sinorhizobium fredii CCBAU 45436]